MKRIVWNLISLLTSLTLIYSCRNCPPGKNIGQAKLSISTTNFIPYLQNETVVLKFKSADGQFIFLQSEKGKVIENIDMVVDTPCSNELIDATYNSMTVENQEIYFKNDSIKILLVAHFRIRAPLINQIDTNWVESVYCIIGNSYNNLNDKSFTLISNNRGKEANQFDIESYLFNDTLTLLNKNFYNVYSDKLGHDIFYNKSIGIIGFRYNSKIYMLENEK